ncbi:hypothetical protein TH66_06130 [Carbonactinospora thermoautotrophica]|uniref:Secreted protein n=1 Tax=Carbonactinospora thermoautotrophica TaxID=1469144 RepID=A0A132N3P1_9ACTN|nr:hypothetical protein [Carbonactinospora thermoautotrophica]KWX04758.1 hypothetical protein TH66_06130 [Carbonactinospora thermoautotrophica]
MPELLVVILVISVLFVGVTAGSVALAVYLTRRLAVAARARAGELADRARTRATALAGQGVTAEAARLRLELRTALDSTRRALAAAQAAGWPVGDAPSLVRRLERAAAEVDARLRILGSERGPAWAADQLPRLRQQVRTVTESCGELRAGLSRHGLDVGDAELNHLREDCRIEGQALGTPTPLGWPDAELPRRGDPPRR